MSEPSAKFILVAALTHYRLSCPARDEPVVEELLEFFLDLKTPEDIRKIGF